MFRYLVYKAYHHWAIIVSLVCLVPFMSSCSASPSPTSFASKQAINDKATATLAVTYTPDPNLTSIAQTIAVQSIFSATSSNLLTTSITDKQAPIPTITPAIMPTPSPIQPLPDTINRSPLNYSNGLKARLISQLSLGRTEPVLSLALSPNFKLLAIGGKHQIWIWNTTNGKVVQSVFASATNSDEKGAVSLSWSPDGKQLAAGGLHGIIMVWQINPQTNLLRNGPLRIEPDQDSATWGEEVNVAFSPDGSSLGAIDDKGSIIEWDSQTFSLKMIYDTSYAGHFAWAADGKSIIDDLMDIGYVGDTKFYEPGVDIQKCDNTPYNISWSPDGTKIGLSSQDCELSLMEAPKSGSNTGVTTIRGVSETAKDNGNNSQRRPMSWSPDSHLIAVGNIPTIGKISMWEANSTKNIMTFDTGNKEITAVTWFSTSILITGGLDGEIKFWEIK